MTFQSFLNDPKNYLKTHEMHIANTVAVLACMTSDAPVVVPGGLSRLRWHQRPAGPFPTFAIAGAGPKSKTDIVVDALRSLPLVPRKMIEYILGNSIGDLGLRYLPFTPGHVSYMDISGGARFVMTGPLSGCTIAAVRSAEGNIWFIHANQIGGGMPAAILKQQTGINDLVVGHMGLNIANVITCTSGVDYDGLGFVFGRLKPNGVWKFYSHATNLAHATRTVKWGEL